MLKAIQLSIMKSQTYLMLLLAIWINNSSCKKFLDEKPSKGIRTISNLDDLQALMDNSTIMNNRYCFNGLAVRVADEFYLPPSTWSGQIINNRLNYIWDKDAEDLLEYTGYYQAVNYTNVVLTNLPNIHDNDVAKYNNIKGQALFHRAFAFYHLAQLYCKPYSSTASTDPGIALKMIPDIETASVRSTVQQTYDQIINDLKEAATLLPVSSLALSYFITRPNKIAAFAMLARVYLSMRDYVNAGKYADSCLQLYNTILDYNSINAGINQPFSLTNNPEIIFYATLQGISGSSYLVDTSLYQSYDVDDLRKAVFFLQNSNGYSFKGRYGGNINFCGLATDEMYLTRAECYARANNTDSAMAALNRLISKRWKNTVTYPQYSATDAIDALNIVLAERRKELIYRGTRWMDLRRFNLEGANISLKRIINGTIYTLPPNDLRWVMLFPQQVINLSGISQNPR